MAKKKPARRFTQQVEIGEVTIDADAKNVGSAVGAYASMLKQDCFIGDLHVRFALDGKVILRIARTERIMSGKTTVYERLAHE